jgi:uncharacterized protein (TIGR02452 family)
MARETVAICEAGYYDAPDGRRVNIADALRRAKAGTALYSVQHLPTAPPGCAFYETRFQVRNETTFQAMARLSASGGGPVACLNFASAKNPGGGFLKGSLAQEEALACASGLVPCLLQVPEFYDRHRAHRSALYLDLAIFSPEIPFFRDDAGGLLDHPFLASVITAAAPNAGAVAENEPPNLGLIESTLRRRADLVLAIARSHLVARLVLGAWGCGVFRNDPRMVARVFGELLQKGSKYGGAFAEVIFAVLDRSENQATFRAFESRFSIR